ncbi:MAG TPA: SDR family oxidoreductase [Burkholderiales bacterium]|nr:SDR family oxidoreductase [Burkholderiales bacterium]
MGRLDGKVAFLTGGGAGIAKATAKAYVREGAKVALAEIDREAGERAQREIGEEHALFIHTDVTSDEAVARAIRQTVERFGRLDVLFNCAGGSLQEDVRTHEMSLEIWQKTIALNLLHPFLACRHGIPHMMKAGGGSIINFASHLGMIGSEKPAYAAAKGGIVSFTKTLAAQYADHGIRANAIAPAIVRTERSIKRWENKDMMLAETPTRSMRERQAKTKLYPFSIGEPEHIAAIGVFLASDESRMVNGTTIAADGGRSSYLRVLAE